MNFYEKCTNPSCVICKISEPAIAVLMEGENANEN